ncbi:MAG: MFS transporter [Planctomycetaceae bacterium]|jgi:acyl-[acyl-carrier-protein]-phospholipid O-acyltransferase/long-chain-fatty-acid--[acyl-carrier-protein] ligase|nr:MFS transporter [Planctomycetaceae bacterium]
MDKSTADSKPRSLFNKGFIALIITQFTVAFNDNAFRWLLVPIGKSYADNDTIRLLGGIFLLIPFLMWASVAGYVTDRFSRYKVMFWCKVIEFLLLLVAVLIITMGPSIEGHSSSGFPIKIILLLAILFLLGSQAAFFSPSKYSVIPDLVPESRLSAANGFVAMLTMIACVSGQVVGGYVYFWTTNFQEKIVDGTKNIVAMGIPGGEHIWVTAIVLLGMALIGLVASMFIPRLKAVAPDAKFPRNPFLQSCRDIATLFSYKNLFYAAIASAFFWGLAAFATNNIDKFATEYLKVQQQHVTVLIAILSIGIGVGSLVCGVLSGKRIELGFVPVGAIGMGVIIFFLGLTPNYGGVVGIGMGNPFDHPYIFATAMMLLTGLFAGFYDVPLAAYIQRNSPQEKRGRILAASNFLTFSTMIIFLSAGMVGVIIFNAINKLNLKWSICNYDPSLLIWMSAGLFTVFVGVILLYNLWAKFLVNAIRFILIAFYRPKIIGLENIPEDGGFIVTSNHVSLVDGMLLAAISPKMIRFLAFEPMIPKFFEPLVRETGLIKLLPGKKAVVAIRAAREGLRNGDIIGIFPEGGITRNSQMRQFESGFLSILKGNPEAPIIPVYIHGLFGSMLSYKFGDKIKFAPKHLPTGVTIAFGKPIYNPQNSLQVQLAVQELGSEICCEPSRKRHPIPARSLIKTCKKRKFVVLFGASDNDGGTVTGGKFLEFTLRLRRLMNLNLLGKRQDEQNIGILIPASATAAITNAAITIDRRTAINLDCNSDIQTLNKIIHDAKIKHVFMSNKFENLSQIVQNKIDVSIIFVEELFDKSTSFDNLLTKFQSLICPRIFLELGLGLLSRRRYEDIVTIIYDGDVDAQNNNNNNSAVTDNMPRGVVLTNSNLAEAGRGFIDALRLSESDVIFGSASFSRSLGYAGTFWGTFLSGGSCLFSKIDDKLISVTKNPSTEQNHKSKSSAFYNFETLKTRLLPSDVTFWATELQELNEFISDSDNGGNGFGFDFGKLRTLVCGVGVEGVGEVTEEVFDKFENKFGVRPVTGLLSAEFVLFATLNVPPSRRIDDFHIYCKKGSVGRAIAGVTIKTINPETGEDTKPNETGLIIIKSPTTPKPKNNGWHQTKLKGKIDEDGFIWLN